MKASAGKRILMLLENHAYPQDDRVRREALSLTQAGYQVSIICPKGSKQSGYEVINGVQVYRYPKPPDGNGFIGYLWEYGYSLVAMFILSVWVFFRRGFDIIHAHNPPDVMVLVAALYKPLGKKFVFDHHDLAPEMYFARFEGEGSQVVFRGLAFFEKLTCRLANHVIATNQSYKTMEMQRSGIPDERITIVRNGPDLARLHPVEPDPVLRQKASTILGYVGVMGFQDGVDYFLRAVQHLTRDLGCTDIYCVIIGKGDAWEGLQNITRQLGIQDYVWFTGRISDEDLLRYLSTADICIDPDPSNPFNDRSTMIKMMEYMALGRPIVAFDLPEHRVSAQEAAIYARGNDEMDFARQIAWLIEHPEKRQEMSAFGTKRVQSELAWTYQEKNLLAAYTTLVPVENRQVKT
jgi:glycosyltransferase involved in cell wall biosynthesis